MRYIFDNDLHIHSKVSCCSNDPAQTTERILRYAEENNLKTICLTDHFWDEKVQGNLIDFYKLQNFEHIIKTKPFPKKKGIDFLFGCETEMDKNFNIGISRERFDEWRSAANFIWEVTHITRKDLMRQRYILNG